MQDPDANILQIHFTSNQGEDDICIRISMTANSISQRLEATELYCCKGINSNRQPYWLQNKVWGKGDRGLEIRSAIILPFFSVLFLSMVQQKFVGAEYIHKICWPLRTRRRFPFSTKIRRVDWYSVSEQPTVFIFRVVENPFEITFYLM